MVNSLKLFEMWITDCFYSLSPNHQISVNVKAKALGFTRESAILDFRMIFFYVGNRRVVDQRMHFYNNNNIHRDFDERSTTIKHVLCAEQSTPMLDRVASQMKWPDTRI